MDFLRRTWAEVDLDNLVYNCRSINKILSPGSQMMAVVKADAYGHGDIAVACELESQGVGWFGVSNIEEALRLRDAGIKGEILILGPTPTEYCNIIYENNITQTIHTAEYAKKLGDVAQQEDVRIKCHIKVDTGMHRIGFDSRCVEIIDQLQQLYTSLSLEVTGIFTHFASADELSEDGIAYTEGQFSSFMRICTHLEDRGISLGLRHCCNSAGTILYPQMHLDLVRCGIILYGMDPSAQCKGKIDIKPVMNLYSVVTMVKEIVEGDQISYGRIYTAKEKRRVATVAIGYADGYNRNLSGRGRMIVKGQYAPVIGRVCMDQLLVDITNIKDVKEGDTVTIVGRQGSACLDFDEMAALCDTINYEKTCLVGRRVTRVFRKGGSLSKVLSYLMND